MIRISSYKYILQQAKNKASTSTKLLQSRPARPSGRSTSKENSIRIPYNSFTFFSGKYVPKHGFGDMLKKSVAQILEPWKVDQIYMKFKTDKAILSNFNPLQQVGHLCDGHLSGCVGW